MNTLTFNPSSSTIMLMDINSCFATIEQQANPLLRGKPIVVAAFVTDKGTILASSIEAKRLGIKTGMRVLEGKLIYPGLVVLTPDANKYRFVHYKLKNIIAEYTDDFAAKSIDEFVLNLADYSTINTQPLTELAQEIKARIKKEIGEWITVSIGIAPNRYLAKVAAGIKKPDGLIEINKDNFLEIYSGLKLTDLTGIKAANASRLNSMGIYSVMDFYEAPVWKLKAAFHSITGLYWHTRLAGYEADPVEYERRSFGNSTSIGKNIYKIQDISPILARLTEKMSSRLRAAGYKARGIHLAIAYKNHSFWHKSKLLDRSKFDSRDFYQSIFKLLIEANPQTPVLNLAVSCFGLSKEAVLQLEFFDDASKKESLVKSQDFINEKWGDFTVSMARSMNGSKIVLDRIGFGRVKEL